MIQSFTSFLPSQETDFIDYVLNKSKTFLPDYILEGLF